MYMVAKHEAAQGSIHSSWQKGVWLWVLPQAEEAREHC